MFEVEEERKPGRRRGSGIDGCCSWPWILKIVEKTRVESVEAMLEEMEVVLYNECLDPG